MNHGRVKASHCCKNVYRVKMAAAPLTQVSPLLPGHLVHVCSVGMWGPACLQGHFQFKNRLGVTFPPHTAFSQQSPFIFVSFSSFYLRRWGFTYISVSSQIPRRGHVQDPLEHGMYPHMSLHRNTVISRKSLGSCC